MSQRDVIVHVDRVQRLVAPGSLTIWWVRFLKFKLLFNNFFNYPRHIKFYKVITNDFDIVFLAFRLLIHCSLTYLNFHRLRRYNLYMRQHTWAHVYDKSITLMYTVHVYQFDIYNEQLLNVCWSNFYIHRNVNQMSVSEFPAPVPNSQASWQQRSPLGHLKMHTIDVVNACIVSRR